MIGKALLFYLIAATAFFMVGQLQGESGEGESLFPLKVSSNGRYLETADGRPFFINGDTPWSLTHNLVFEEAVTYMKDRVAKGMNALIVSAPDAYAPDGSRTYPPDQYGRHPFTEDDIARPDKVYWDHVVRVLKKSEELGLLVLFFPAYLGCCEDGYIDLFLQNGIEKAERYGRWIGELLKNRQNLIWVHGGDRNVNGTEEIVRAVSRGIRRSDPKKLHTVHWAPETAPWVPFGEDWLDIYSAYTYGPVAARVHANYLHEPTKPVILIESDYEGDFNHKTAEDVRRFPYRALLSGAAGHFFGNRPLWFCGEGWEEALGRPGSQYMKIAGEFIRSIPWHVLVPEREHELVPEGSDFASDSGVQVARTASGDLALIFLPSSRLLTVDLRTLKANMVSATWFQPGTGKRLNAGRHSTESTVVFEPPSTGDWLLLLEKLSGQLGQ